jgi:hypothetical protein
MAAPNAKVESEWSAHVWKWVKEEFDSLVKLPALSKAEGGVGVVCEFDKEIHMKEFTKHMQEYKEYRGVVSNVCCTPPEATSIPGDEIVMDMLGDMARFRFYKDGKPCAPTVWPKDSNIPVALYEIAKPGKDNVERFAKDGVVQAFWWAFAQAMQAVNAERLKTPPSSEEVYKALQIVQGFRKLARNCLFDYQLFPDRLCSFFSLPVLLPFGGFCLRLVFEVVSWSSCCRRRAAIPPGRPATSLPFKNLRRSKRTRKGLVSQGPARSISSSGQTLC